MHLVPLVIKNKECILQKEASQPDLPAGKPVFQAITNHQNPTFLFSSRFIQHKPKQSSLLQDSQFTISPFISSKLEGPTARLSSCSSSSEDTVQAGANPCARKSRWEHPSTGTAFHQWARLADLNPRYSFVRKFLS